MGVFWGLPEPIQVVLGWSDPAEDHLWPDQRDHDERDRAPRLSGISVRSHPRRQVARRGAGLAASGQAIRHALSSATLHGAVVGGGTFPLEVGAQDVLVDPADTRSALTRGHPSTRCSRRLRRLWSRRMGGSPGPVENASDALWSPPAGSPVPGLDVLLVEAMGSARARRIHERLR